MATVTSVRQRIRQEGLRSALTSREFAPYWFLLPYFFFFLLFYGWPLVWAPWMSLHEFNLAGSTFIGIDNYVQLLTTDLMWEALWNTLVIGVIKMPITVGFGLALAVVVNSAYIKYKKAWRTAFLSPMTVSGVVMALLFILLLDEFGMVNYLLGTNIQWLTGGPLIAKTSVALTMVIGGTATNFIFFLAGLAGIPSHLYDAAKVDGANKFQQFRYITLPQIRPMLLLVIILETNASLKIFAQPQILTQGGPEGATTTIVLRLYREAFNNLSLGYAAALGVALTLFLTVLLAVEYVVGNEDVR